VTTIGAQSVVRMGTVVSIEVVHHGEKRSLTAAPEQSAIRRALAWFRKVEACCSRFDERSELRRLSGQIGIAAPVSALLFEAVRFALAVADETAGAFDPTVGYRMEARGFNRNYRTRRLTRPQVPEEGVSFRDVLLDPAARTITLLRPLRLDLGAVAKGLAIDLASRELQPFENFAIYAGGDLYVSGRNRLGLPWRIGIRHPRDPERVIEQLNVSSGAICTSGNYERKSRGAKPAPHLLDSRNGHPAVACASVTVLAPSAMVADALATAAFVLGPVAGRKWLEAYGAEGLIFSPTLKRFATRGTRHG
jgi:FAD:protein FMN transferase